MIPDKVKIGGITYAVVQNKDEALEDSAADAHIKYLKQEIVLRSYMGEDYKARCFCHEVTHGMFEHIGREDLRKDEQLVSAFGNLLHQVLKDNKLYFGGE